MTDDAQEATMSKTTMQDPCAGVGRGYWECDAVGGCDDCRKLARAVGDAERLEDWRAEASVFDVRTFDGRRIACSNTLAVEEPKCDHCGRPVAFSAYEGRYVHTSGSPEILCRWAASRSENVPMAQYRGESYRQVAS